jgi:hypothetical protein
MTRSNQLQQEGRHSLATQALSQKQIKSLRRAALVYNILLTTLHRRKKGQRSRFETPANCRKLTDTEEEVLLGRIFDLDDKGFSPRHAVVRQYANLILDTRDASPRPQHVGKNWVTNFVKRHDALRTMYDRKLDYKRAKCEDPRIIEPWFTLVRDLKAKYGILDDDVDLGGKDASCDERDKASSPAYGRATKD